MDNLKALGRGTQIMFISAVLLLIISFFRWQEASIGPFSAGLNALHGFWGWMMFLLTIVLVARIAARLAAVEIPIPLSFATTSFVLGILIAVCAVLKVITDDYTKFWAYIGVVLAILVAVGAWLEVKEAGGVEHLRDQASSLGAGSSGAAAGTAAAETTQPSAPAPAAMESPAPPEAPPTPPAAASPAAETPPSPPSTAEPAPAAPQAESATAATAADVAPATTDPAGGEAAAGAPETAPPASEAEDGPPAGGG